MQNLLAILIRRLASADRESVWLLTGRGYDYDFERRWQEGAEPDEKELQKLHRTPGEQVDDIAERIRNELYDHAIAADLDAEVRHHHRSLKR